jgi:hypothetical protein
MATDWKSIRELMSAVIDFAEAIEAAGYSEGDRALTVQVNGQTISLYDFMVSAHTLPENLRYEIIRDRHDKGADTPYVSETARAIKAMGEACAELAGAAAAEEKVQAAIRWYRNYAIPQVQKALAAKPA